MPQFLTLKGPFDERYAVFQAKWKTKNCFRLHCIAYAKSRTFLRLRNDYQMKMHMSSEYCINPLYTCSILFKQKDDVVTVTGPVAASLKCSRFSDDFDYQPVFAIKFHIINIRCGTIFCDGRFLEDNC